MSVLVIAENELYDSCRILFGAEMNITRGFLEYLQLSGIKSAYRKKAIETHPDMQTEADDEGKRKSGDLFHVVQQAYENLTSYLDARDRGFKFRTVPKARNHNWASARTAKSQASSFKSRPGTSYNNSSAQNRAKAKTSSNFYTGHNSQSNFNANSFYSYDTRQNRQAQIPHRKLLFGHYLYYCGVANWHTIIKALVWQRTMRPKLGELGRQYGMLDSKDILNILKNRKYSESFGESAVKQGFLTAQQLQQIIFQQKIRQKKFGDFFIHNKILTPNQLNTLITQFRSHNYSVAAQQFSQRGRI